MKQFKVTVYEISNNIIVGRYFRETYIISAENEVIAKEKALEMYGDYSEVRSCYELFPDFPEEPIYSLENDD